MNSRKIASCWCLASALLLVQACTKPQKDVPAPTHTVARATTAGMAPSAAAGTIVSITRTAFVSNFAGDGTPGLVNSTGDFARFNTPGGLTVDDAGNVFVADRGNNVIRKITPFGSVTTYAGTGAIGALDGPANQAQFFYPFGVTVDADGYVYVADTYNNRIRKIRDGMVTTYAGSSYGYQPGLGTAAQFALPFDVVSDRRHQPELFVSDHDNFRIRKITSNTDVQAYAGNEPGFSDGYFPWASFLRPWGMTRGVNGDLFVADPQNSAVRRIRGDIYVETVSTGINNPTGVAADSTGTVYVAAHDWHQVLVITPNNETYALAGNGYAGNTTGIGTNASFNHPYALAVAANGDVYVSEDGGHRIRRMSISSFGNVTTLAGNGSEFVSPGAIAVDAQGITYVADYGTDLIRKINSDGEVSTLAGSTKGFKDGTGAAAQFNSPTGLAIDAQGNVLVADCSNHRIRKITPAGVVTTIAGQATRGFKDARGALAQFNSPYGITVDNTDGTIYVADGGNNRIRKIETDGLVSTVAGSGVAGNADGMAMQAQFHTPAALSIDNRGFIYVADRDNDRIRKIGFNQVTTLAGGTKGFANGVGAAAQFSQPYGIVVDAAGMVYVTDRGNNRIRRITPGGVVSTQAGSGNGTFHDDNGAFASFKLPFGIAMDGMGRLLIGDWDNHRVRVIQ